MRNQIKFTFQIGYLPTHRAKAFQREIISAATIICGGCTTSIADGWWREDGDSHKTAFVGTLHREECFTLELTCEEHKAERAYADMAEYIAIAAANHKIDTDWVHVTETPMVGRHFSVKTLNAVANPA